MAQDRYDELYSDAFDRALVKWLADDDPRYGYDYEQNCKAIHNALCNVWNDEIDDSVSWASRAVMRLNGKS